MIGIIILAVIATIIWYYGFGPGKGPDDEMPA